LCQRVSVTLIRTTFSYQPKLRYCLFEFDLLFMTLFANSIGILASMLFLVTVRLS